MNYSKIATTSGSSNLIGSTIFIAGVYGTGKSTMCSALAKMLHVPAFSAGDLISSINGERYGANKIVSDKYANQLLLIERVHQLIQKNERIILAGHFCIFNSYNEVDILPEFVYSQLSISRIILLEANIQTVISNLISRDGKNYTLESISKLIKKEREQCKRIAEQLSCPFNIYQMTFTEQDTQYVASLISKES